MGNTEGSWNDEHGRYPRQRNGKQESLYVARVPIFAAILSTRGRPREWNERVRFRVREQRREKQGINRETLCKALNKANKSIEQRKKAIRSSQGSQAGDDSFQDAQLVFIFSS